MIVAVHQPNFAPWLGFFDKMAHSDVFVFLDTTPLTRGSYQNRVMIKSKSGPQWLTVPLLRKGRYNELTYQAEFNNNTDWRAAHLRTVRCLLGRAPHFSELLDSVQPIYSRTDLHRLREFNVALIRDMAARLGIRTRLVLASELGCPGRSTRLLARITKAVGGDVYLSGPSGRDYLEPEVLADEGVELRYHRFVPFEYPQRFGSFVPGLSCFDYFANVGFRPWSGMLADGQRSACQ